MSAVLTVDPALAEPPYEQIRAQITSFIEQGLLAPGDRLPPVRRLAVELELAASTVARAYRELEANGLTVSRRGAGTTVAEHPANLDTQERELRLDAELQGFAKRLKVRGYKADEIAAAYARFSG